MNIPQLDPNYCLEKHLFQHSRKSHTLYLTAALAVFLALLSLPFVYVDIVVHGVGIVRPITEKVELKAPVSEGIAQVLSKEGCTVRAGDTILLLNSVSADASLFNQQSLLQDLESQLADLQVLCKQLNGPFRTEKRHQEYVLFQRQKEELGLSIEAAEKKRKRNEPLFKSGVIPQDEYENYVHEQQRFERELKTLFDNRMTLWKADRSELTRQLSEARAEQERLKQARKLLVVTAPVTGTLEQFSGLYPGGRVCSGQSLGCISPDSTLVVECYLPPKDIGFVRVSMKMQVLVEAFDYNQWGKLNGLVSDISSDFVLMNDLPCYKIRCSIDKPFLCLKNGRRGRLKKGMTVKTRFLVNRRSLFNLIYEKMDDWANPMN